MKVGNDFKIDEKYKDVKVLDVGVIPKVEHIKHHTTERKRNNDGKFKI